MNTVDEGKVSQLIQSVDHLLVDDINQEMKTLLLQPAMRMFPNHPRRAYIKTSNGACMKGYGKRCHKSMRDYYKA